MVLVFSAFKVATAKAITQKYKQKNDENRILIQKHEKLIRHLESESTAQKEVLANQKNAIDILQYKLDKKDKDHVALRNELFGIKPA